MSTKTYWQLAIRKPGMEFDKHYGLGFMATKAEAKNKLAEEIAFSKRLNRDYADYIVLIHASEFRAEPARSVSFHCEND